MKKFWTGYTAEPCLERLLALPCRLELRHRLLAARRITAICSALRETRGDRPKPWRALRRLRVQHDAADGAPVFVQDLVVVFQLAAA